MRKAILISIFVLKCLLALQFLQAQAPQSFSYQAVLRDEKGLPLAKGTEPGLSISLRQGSRTGAVVYNETYQKGGNPALRSNDFGIITLEVGKLKPSDFGQINCQLGSAAIAKIKKTKQSNHSNHRPGVDSQPRRKS